MEESNIESRIIHAMARTLWLTSWADEKEERGETEGWSGAELNDLAPATPEKADVYARRFAHLLITKNGYTLVEGLLRSLMEDVRMGKLNPVGLDLEDLADKFGHYIVMEKLGHGVSWTDDHESLELDLNVKFDADSVSMLLRAIVE